ncbi:MAG: AraC family transcriptional regulator [Ruthenibacterium sp.]
MIFKPETLCTPLYCRELSDDGTGTAELCAAPFAAVLVSHGHAALSAGGEAQLLGAGGLLIARGAVEVTPATDCHLLAVGLGGLAASAAAQTLSQPVLSDAAVCPLAGQAMAELCEAVAHGASAVQQSECAYRVLCALAEADASAKALPPLVADAVLAIRRNYAGLYGVEELSAQLGVSKSHLVRVFSAAIGVPPGRYLTEVRVAAAKNLLAQRDYPLEVIASLCGFSGANYFCKVFKKATGTQPAAYRALHGGTADKGSAVAVSAQEKELYI